MIKLRVFLISFVFGLLEFASTLPHPIQDADNNTRCEFAFIPTGYLTIGKTLSVPGECMLVTCQDDLTVTGLTCPTYFNLPGCYLTELNRYKEYPECCPQMICKFNRFDRYRSRKRRAQRKYSGTSSK